MDSEDPLDLAQAAIARIADIASSLGVEHRRPVCGRLGAELLLVAHYIDTAGLDQEKRLRVRISKLMRDVEIICNWPNKVAGTNCRLLQAIGQSIPGMSSYKTTEAEIRRGLSKLTANSLDAEEVIRHIRKFTKQDRMSARRHASDDTTSTQKVSRPERPTHINGLVHRTLREHMCCTCENKGVREQARANHLVRLLLQPPSWQLNSPSLISFHMLFSSKPSSNETYFSHWQDVELMVSSQTKAKKRARFLDTNQETAGIPLINTSPAKSLAPVDKGQLCDLIRLEANSRLCLTIQDGELQSSGFEALKQIVMHAPGISLARILSLYHLTARMKLVMAYIIAYSIWQYYDSDWMNNRWTSETIQFMQECGSSHPSDRGKLFTWKPYLSVRFNEEDPESYEFNDIVGGIHHYPRIRALGIMLVEIGIGSPFDREESQQLPLAAKINKMLLLAVDYAKDARLWRDFDYPNYMSAVHHCLDPEIFNLAPFIKGMSDHDLNEGLKQRRNILYDKVVFPLEELLQGTKWMDDLTKVAPLETLSKATTWQDQLSGNENSVERKVPKKTRTKSEKGASEWLSRMQHFNGELAQHTVVVGLSSSSTRVRIAILDTGLDDNVPFFLNPDNSARLKGWKDWVDGSDQPTDCHGHGTHLTSLVMKVAPEADIYVARVAKSPRHLLESSEDVAKAIAWASGEWNADIISMSFGYAEQQPCISRAIRSAVSDRDGSILFFAAASNYGANESEMFPARHESVISIRGTNTNGDFEDFNPPRSLNEETVFGTLGVDVPAAWSDHDNEVYKSGTSVATAIAAGIAGTLLQYINFKSTNQGVKRRACTRQGMEAIFRALSSPTLKERYLYLTTWKIMGKPEDVRWAILIVALSDL